MEKRITFSQLQASNNARNELLTRDLASAEDANEFKLYIMWGEDKFHVALNNKAAGHFKYCQNIADLQLQSIEITGKLKYIKQLNHHKYFPRIWPPIQITDDCVDFSNDQPMSFGAGHVVVIMARLEGNSRGRFVMQFRHARDNGRQELHVSVRFDTKKVVRNCKWRQGDNKLAFGEEEFDDATTFPFEDFSKPFKLAVAFRETDCRFAKDGQALFKFSYRSPNILGWIMGPKIFGSDGLHVRVWGIEHLRLDDELCGDFEKYSL